MLNKRSGAYSRKYGGKKVSCRRFRRSTVTLPQPKLPFTPSITSASPFLNKYVNIVLHRLLKWIRKCARISSCWLLLLRHWGVASAKQIYYKYRKTEKQKRGKKPKDKKCLSSEIPPTQFHICKRDLTIRQRRRKETWSRPSVAVGIPSKTLHYEKILNNASFPTFVKLFVLSYLRVSSTSFRWYHAKSTRHHFSGLCI